MRYFLLVRSYLTNSLRLFSLSCLAFQSWGSPLTLKTKLKRKGDYVSNSSSMKRWLKKIPTAMREINAEQSNITHIDIQWKQKKVTKTFAKSKKPKAVYTCTLQFTIKYESLSASEEAPLQIATPAPLTVNSRCDKFLANNDIESLIRSNSNT